MARYLGSKCRICRREGSKLFLKGNRCSTERCSFVKRPYAPGEKGKMGKVTKASYYAQQLREKQKVKRMYGILERQFRKYFHEAARVKGKTGRALIQLLERRLDNVIFRLLFAVSRNQARQIVRNGFVYVNGRKVNIPSFLVKKDDKIQVKMKQKQAFAKDNLEVASKSRSVPAWLFQDKENFRGEILRLPEKEDLVLPINDQMIIELYSK